MPADGHQLGIDFGTSNTVAVVRWPDGRVRPLIFEGSPLLPSAVYAEPGGGILVGRDAVHSSRLDPARYEPNPKRRVDDGTLLLGEREIPVVELIAAVLGRVSEEWTRTVGPVRPRVTLTCPATWGATRRQGLVDAARRVGFADVRLVAEPVAAATYFAQVLGRDVPIGSVVVVHDLGAGTFDASVVARTSSGFDVLAVDGRDDIGGLDVDAGVIAHVEKVYGGRNPDAWARLRNPSTVEERRAKRLLWDDVKAAKERLSRTPTADLVVPLADVEVHLTREELEDLARPLLEQTVRVTHGVIRWANLAPGRLAGVFLVGGSSRIPLMATLLHRRLGEAPVVLEQPELVVAEGSIHAAALAMPVDSSGAAPGPATGLLPRIPVEAFGAAGMPGVPGAAPVAPAAPVSPAPVSASPVSASPVSASPVSASPVPAVPVPVSGAPAASRSVTAPERSVGRVIVPGAAPPGQRRSSQPLAPTRYMPRPPVAQQAPAPVPQAMPAAPASPARPQVPVSPPPAPSPRPAAVFRYPVPSPPVRSGPGLGRRIAVRLLVTLVLVTVPVVAALVAYYLTTGHLPDLGGIFGS